MIVESKTILEVIQSIPLIKKGYDFVKSFLHKLIKIEVFLDQEFIKRVCPCHDILCKCYDGRPANLQHQKDSVGICINNNGKETIRLDQITLTIYSRCKKRKLLFEIKSKKHNDGFPKQISPKGYEGGNWYPEFDSSEKGALIYEVIAIIDNRKIKHVHGESIVMKTRYWMFGLIIVIGVILDQWTKMLVVNHIHSLDDFQHWLPVLSIVRTHNMGVSFGMFSAMNLGPWFYGVLSLSIIAFLVYMIVKTPRMIPQLAFVFMISGAIGNLIDRFMHGYVVDFISVHWFEKYYFYVFNVADIFVSCGAGLIILDALIEKRTQK